MYVIMCVGMYIHVYLRYPCIIFVIVDRLIHFTIKVNVTEYECANVGVSDDICIYVRMYVCIPLYMLVRM